MAVLMAGQFREPGRAERLEVAAFEALIEAEHTEARRRAATAATHPARVEAARPDETTQENA